MASVLRNLISRLGASKPGADVAPISARVPASGKVPVIVRSYDDEDEPAHEPSQVRGATVRSFRCEPDAEDANDADTSSTDSALFAIDAAGVTDRGMRRKSNEDALLLLRKQSVYVVADGMGGHAGGEVASKLAVDTIAASFRDGAPPSHALMHVPPFAAELVQSIGAANEAVHSAASKDELLSDMGTTVVAARFDAAKGRLYVGHVGDSRCYRLRDGALEQITRDHTMSELGVTGREGGYLSRAVGPKVVVEADVAVVETRLGDVYLLCTDGLTKMIPDASIRGVLLDEEAPEDAAASLIGRANAAGGRDNVTALVIRIGSS